MNEELRAELPDLIDQLASLETVLSVETQIIQDGDFETLQGLQSEKSQLVPVLQRANSVIRALSQLEGGINIDEDDDLYDLAVMMINVNRAAVENENAIVGAIRATQFTIRTMVKAMRSEHGKSFQRYTRSGNTIALRGPAGMTPKEM